MGENHLNVIKMKLMKIKWSIPISWFITIYRSILQSEKESLTLLQFPVGKDKEPITIIEVGPSTHACPNGLCKLVLYFINVIWTKPLISSS